MSFFSPPDPELQPLCLRVSQQPSLPLLLPGLCQLGVCPPPTVRPGAAIHAEESCRASLCTAVTSHAAAGDRSRGRTFFPSTVTSSPGVSLCNVAFLFTRVTWAVRACWFCSTRCSTSSVPRVASPPQRGVFQAQCSAAFSNCTRNFRLKSEVTGRLIILACWQGFSSSPSLLLRAKAERQAGGNRNVFSRPPLVILK